MAALQYKFVAVGLPGDIYVPIPSYLVTFDDYLYARYLEGLTAASSPVVPPSAVSVAAISGFTSFDMTGYDVWYNRPTETWTTVSDLSAMCTLAVTTYRFIHAIVLADRGGSPPINMNDQQLLDHPLFDAHFQSRSIWEYFDACKTHNAVVHMELIDPFVPEVVV